MADGKFFDALKARTELEEYDSNAHLLFALELALGVEDIETVAEAALTDGPDDKKCDLLYVDRDSGHVVIAQGYWADEDKKEAPANKASHLNTAVSWLFGKSVEELPEGLRPAAEELQAALKDDAIFAVEIWYCHNLPESVNVGKELKVVEATAQTLIGRFFPDANVDSVRATEAGRDTLNKWYASREVAIFVTEDFHIPIEGGYVASGDRWIAYNTSIPATWLHDQFHKYKSDLFSANVRDYLGSRRSKKNINNGIKQTARETPTRFWAYNNGVTALVNGFEVEDGEDGSRLKLHGIAIVNGAQTSGALGSVDRDDLEDAEVMARFVKCSDQKVIHEIIQYNNSQNPTEAADFRSNDSVQERLRTEFETDVPDVNYQGGRRGGYEDKIKRPRDIVPHYTAAQSLAAFHGEAATAYNEKSRIWEEDKIYSRFFGDHTSARHILFCFSLLRTIEKSKRAVSKKAHEDRTKQEQDQFEYFRRRGSHFLLMQAIGDCMEVFLGRAVPDPFGLKFEDSTSYKHAKSKWEPIVVTSLSFTKPLSDVLGYHLKNREKVADAVETFRALVSATAEANRAQYEAFASSVEGAIPAPHKTDSDDDEDES